MPCPRSGIPALILVDSASGKEVSRVDPADPKEFSTWAAQHLL
jgi:hypothetical protein